MAKGRKKEAVEQVEVPAVEPVVEQPTVEQPAVVAPARPKIMVHRSMTKAEHDQRVATAQQQEGQTKGPVDLLVYDKPRKKVAILGFTSSWQAAPFSHPEFEVWGLNELYLYIPRWDRWFEIHSRELYSTDKNRTHDHILRLQQMACPIYMQRHWDDIPNSLPYPLQEVMALSKYGGYLTNSISYMIGLAILEGFEEIHVYGVDMSHDSEYASQRPSCEFWLGLAEGRGIKIHLAPQSDLLSCAFMYGFQEQEQHRFLAKLASRKADMEASANRLGAEINERQAAFHQYQGALQDINHILKIWKGEPGLTS